MNRNPLVIVLIVLLILVAFGHVGGLPLIYGGPLGGLILIVLILVATGVI
jgi:hypothetical protein